MAFIDDSTDIAISHRSVRLRRLDALITRIEEKLDGDLPKKNLMLLIQLIGETRTLYEQAAKEVGGSFLRDGANLNVNVDLDKLTDAQLDHLAAGGSLAKLPR